MSEFTFAAQEIDEGIDFRFATFLIPVSVYRIIGFDIIEFAIDKTMSYSEAKQHFLQGL